MANAQVWSASSNVRSGLEAASTQRNHDWSGNFSSRRATRFAAFEVDLEAHELRKHGIRMRIAEKPFQILELLLARAGQVVTRKALREKLWPDTHVGFEHSLNTAVNTLRGLLGDSANNPRFIETLPRVGYRFISTVIHPADAKLASTRKMLAVLPFENLGGSPEHDFFSDGLTDEMISQLGQVNPSRLGVIARTSAIQYKGTKKSIAEIARELHVECVLEGSVRRQERHVRVTVQLIQAADETHQWSASYDRELRDVLSLQSEVARAVATALELVLLSAISAAPELGQDSESRETPKDDLAYGVA